MDDKNELTISHNHIVAVQENEKSKEGSDGDEEGGDTEEDVEEMSDDDYDGFAFAQNDVVCSMQDKADISSSVRG